MVTGIMSKKMETKVKLGRVILVGLLIETGFPFRSCACTGDSASAASWSKELLVILS
jgi:hypothetical protein